ncbi:hypothetical protein V6259_18015 [Marinomonas sp. TI.3.20]|uniref:hypothetical protein n=1 Tax=Marinomonas sp. TI.3.20 TaxID=3121296 RepID=UPI00311F40F9
MIGQEKVKIKSILIEQLEGRPSKRLTHSVQDAINAMSFLAMSGDHYKGSFTITWDNGGCYKGTLVFHKNMRVINPLVLAKEYLERCVDEDFQYGNFNNQASEVLNEYF